MRVLFGTYGDAESGEKGGIFQSVLDNSGKLTPPECLVRCDNPSYLAWGRDRRTLYATQEHLDPERAGVAAFSVDENGALTLMNQATVGGYGCCHIAVSPNADQLATAQYNSGHVSLFELGEKGEIGTRRFASAASGQGTHPIRQEGSHAHFVAFLSEPEQLIALDFGLDQMRIYGAEGDQFEVLQFPSGTGPRHLVPSADGAELFVYGELEESVFRVRRTNGRFEILSQTPVFAPPTDEDGAGSAIRLSPCGKYLYVASRVENQLACVAIAPDKLEVQGKVSCSGHHPRDFELSSCGGFVVVANQLSNQVAVMKRDQTNGALSAPHTTLKLPRVACVLF
ncbi:lactonase family protein [Falsihalocynthiibacter sp. SS001]|uniref:lactonase family protein n=1 Tax=Falsihalocynthiibacter sp. SS001 TaxID=3349698 RepID=UPI0036D2547E